MTDNPKANLEPDRVTCVHCGADSNRRTGKPFTAFGILAHLKSCPKRSNPAQDSAAGTCAGKNDDSPAQGANQDNNILRRERHNPASLSHSMRVEKKAGKNRERESDDAPSLAYEKYLPPEKTPGGNDPIDLPLPMERKDAAYVLAVLGGCLSGIEHSVTRMYIRGSRLTPGQTDVLDAALIKLLEAEDEHKKWEEQMKKARMTPEERSAASDAEFKERERRYQEQQAADWNAGIERIRQRDEEREKNGEPFEKDDPPEPPKSRPPASVLDDEASKWAAPEDPAPLDAARTSGTSP